MRPVAGSANNRSISLWDSVPQIERARNGFNWALNIAYKVSLTRQNNQYACASTDGGTGTKNANNQTNSTPGDKPAVALYGTNARVSYVLVIQSP